MRISNVFRRNQTKTIKDGETTTTDDNQRDKRDMREKPLKVK
jgi:hypothetical protein